MTIIIFFTRPDNTEYNELWKNFGDEKTICDNICCRHKQECQWQAWIFPGENFQVDNKWNMEKIQCIIKEIGSQDSNDGHEVGIFIHSIASIGWQGEAGCVNYSSTYKIYDTVKAFAAGKDLAENFTALWGKVESERKNERFVAAQRMRHDLLSPLVAYELLSVLKVNNTEIAEEIKECIKEIKPDVWPQDFSAKIGNGFDENQCCNYLKMIKNYICSETSIQKPLTALATLLDGAICPMSSGAS